jgi:hypothetical protein
VTTDDVVVIVWNATALVSLAVSLVSLGGALADWEFLRERHINGLRSIQAGANLRTHGTRALVALLFLFIGTLVLVESPWRGAISRWLLIVASLLLTVGAVFDWYDRRRSLRLLISRGETVPPTEGHVPPAAMGAES